MKKLSRYLKRADIFRRTPDAFDDKAELPVGYTGKNSQISILAHGRVGIDGCRSLLVYEDEKIVVRLCDCTMSITGDTLTLRTFFGNRMTVCGNIKSVAFEYCE